MMVTNELLCKHKNALHYILLPLLPIGYKGLKLIFCCIFRSSS